MNNVDAAQALADLHTLARGNDYANEHDVNRLFLAVDDALDAAIARAERAEAEVARLREALVALRPYFGKLARDKAVTDSYFDAAREAFAFLDEDRQP